MRVLLLFVAVALIGITFYHTEFGAPETNFPVPAVDWSDSKMFYHRSTEDKPAQQPAPKKRRERNDDPNPHVSRIC